MWVFVPQVCKEIAEIHTKDYSGNVTQAQKQALHSQNTNEGVIIKPPDKGGNVVLMDRDQYVNMCLINLQN